MSDVEQIEHDARTCELCCPHGITPQEAEAERVHAAILRAQDDRIEQRRGAAKADLNWSSEPIGLRPDVVIESPHNHSGEVAWR